MKLKITIGYIFAIGSIASLVEFFLDSNERMQLVNMADLIAHVGGRVLGGLYGFWLILSEVNKTKFFKVKYFFKIVSILISTTLMLTVFFLFFVILEYNITTRAILIESLNVILFITFLFILIHDIKSLYKEIRTPKMQEEKNA